MTKELNDQDFIQATADGIVLIDFYAEWCGPCKMIAPLIDQLSEEITDAKIVKVNVDESPLTASKFGIRSVPTFIVLKNGIEVTRNVGAQPQKVYFTGMIDAAR